MINISRKGLLVLMVALIGCGDDTATTNGDAGTDDAADAQGTDALVDGPVTVTYHQAPAGSRAVFLTAADELVADLELDVSGQAQAQLQAGGSVNVITLANGATIRHVLGVKPGDAITIGSPTPTTVQVMVNVPNLVNATAYDVSSPCGAASGAASQVTVTLTGCGATTDFHVVARGPSVLRTLLVRNVAVTTTITLTGTYVAPRTASYTFLNLPSGLFEVLGYVDVEAQTTPPWDLGPRLFANGSAPAGVFVLSGGLPDLAMPRALARVHMNKVNTSSQTHYFEGPIDYSDSLDVGPLVLPWITATGTDKAASRVTWTEVAGGGGIPDLVWAAVETRLPSGSGDIVGRHMIVGPYVSGQVHVPVLPAPYTDFNVTPATMTLGPNVILYEAQDVDRGRQRACVSAPCQLVPRELRPVDGHAASSSSP
jgi:hypothetical protein